MDFHGVRLSLGIRMMAFTLSGSGRMRQARKVLIRTSRRPDLPANVRLDYSGRGERRANQGRKGVRAGLAHDGSAMVVDRALADAEIGGDVLARVAGDHQVQDLALAQGQT